MRAILLVVCGIVYYIVLFMLAKMIIHAFNIKREKTTIGIILGVGIIPLFCILDYIFRGNPFLEFVSSFGYILLGFFLYYVLALPIIIGIKKIISLIKKKEMKILGKSGILIAAALSCIVCIIGVICAQVPETKNYKLDIGLKQRMRITVVSDIHYGATGSMLSLDKMVHNINKTNADVVLLVGDVFDNKTKKLNHEKFVTTMNKIESKYGTYAVTGNHEFMTNTLEEIAKFYEGTNIRLLLDEEIVIQDVFRLVGRIDYRGGRKELNEVITSNDLPIIVLDHQPQFYREAKDLADLQISGHTHNGQIFPGDLLIGLLNLIAYQSPSDGLHHYDDFILSITRGYGTWGFPMRLSGPSQIVTYDL
ncbi:MAG: metallophosphoesterase [Anaeroplasmataceae bacterium]|nr:metallophosphoesterase [Anaeroplasmataceae bacterium]